MDWCLHARVGPRCAARQHPATRWVIGRWLVGHWVIGRWLVGHWVVGYWVIGGWVIGCWVIGCWVIGCWVIGCWVLGRWGALVHPIPASRGLTAGYHSLVPPAAEASGGRNVR